MSNTLRFADATDTRIPPVYSARRRGGENKKEKEKETHLKKRGESLKKRHVPDATLKQYRHSKLVYNPEQHLRLVTRPYDYGTDAASTQG